MNKNDIEKLLNEKQKFIAEELEKFSPSLNSLYLGGIRLNASKNEYEAYTLSISHIIREIECGLLSFLIGAKTLKEINKNNKKRKHEKLFSILKLNKNHPIAKKWKKLEPVETAHRSEIYKKVRPKTEGEKQWKDFQDILEWLLGECYSALGFIDKILSEYDNPQQSLEDNNNYEWSNKEIW